MRGEEKDREKERRKNQVRRGGRGEQRMRGEEKDREKERRKNQVRRGGRGEQRMRGEEKDREKESRKGEKQQGPGPPYLGREPWGGAPRPGPDIGAGGPTTAS